VSHSTDVGCISEEKTMDDHEYFLADLAEKVERLLAGKLARLRPEDSIPKKLRTIATLWHNRLETGPRYGENSITFASTYFRQPDGSIHMTSPVLGDFHVAINEDASRRNGHPTLYRRLNALLPPR
jgi:hypothetical protein